MKLLLWCASAASLQGAAAERPTSAPGAGSALGPNFDATVEALWDDVNEGMRSLFSSCYNGEYSDKRCHSILMSVLDGRLEGSNDADRSATRDCERTCVAARAGHRCIEPCKKLLLGDAYGSWKVYRKILMTYLGIEQTVWGRLRKAVSNMTAGTDWDALGRALLAVFIPFGSWILACKFISQDLYRLAFFIVCLPLEIVIGWTLFVENMRL